MTDTAKDVMKMLEDEGLENEYDEVPIIIPPKSMNSEESLETLLAFETQCEQPLEWKKDVVSSWNSEVSEPAKRDDEVRLRWIEIQQSNHKKTKAKSNESGKSKDSNKAKRWPWDNDQTLNFTYIDPYRISKKSITPKARDKKLENNPPIWSKPWKRNKQKYMKNK